MSHLLLVDKDRYGLELMTHLLEASGHEVTQAVTHEQALRAVTEDPVDLLVTELELKGFHANEIIKTLRKSGKRPDAPVIVISGELTKHALINSYKLGVRSFIPKSEFAIPEFMREVDNLLTQSPAVTKNGPASGEPSSAQGVSSSAAPTDEETASFSLPPQDKILASFNMLLDREIATSEPEDTRLDLSRPAMLATYIDDDNKLAALAVSEHALGCSLGCALTMIPTEVARKQIEQAAAEDETLENLQEVFNIFANLFNQCSEGHLVLGQVITLPQDQVDQEVKLLVDQPGQSLCVQLSLQDYDQGRLWVLVRK